MELDNVIKCSQAIMEWDRVIYDIEQEILKLDSQYATVCQTLQRYKTQRVAAYKELEVEVRKCKL